MKRNLLSIFVVISLLAGMALIFSGCSVTSRGRIIERPDREASGWQFVGSGDDPLATIALTEGVILFSEITLMISEDGDVYFGYSDYEQSPAGDARPSISKFNAGTGAWAAVGERRFGPPVPSGWTSSDYYLRIIYDPTDNLIYDDQVIVEAVDGNDSAKKTQALEYNSQTSTWDILPAAGHASNGAARDGDIALNDSNELYIVYRDPDNLNKATVRKYNGATWADVGSTFFTPAGAMQPKLAFGSSTPNIAYIDWANGTRVSVMQWSGVSWGNLGNGGFSSYSAESLDFAIYNNVPYIAYDEGISAGGATVMYHDSDSATWNVLGQERFSPGAANKISLDIYNGIPYVAFIDGANDNKISVMKYADGVWSMVGSAGFSAGEAGDVAMVVHNGTPYVGYSEVEGSYYKGYVKKYQ